MAGTTSYYSRLKSMLETAGSREVRESSEFVLSIVQKSPPQFVYHRWDDDEDKIAARCSESAVRKTFGLAAELGILDRETGKLTRLGKEAADQAHFDKIVRQRVRLYLKQLGCPLDQVNSACIAMLGGKRIVLPTMDELYLEVCVGNGINIPRSLFGIFLRVLAASGGITISRRHIFLPSGS